jgi:DNA (cytosine-5)-methyltransferase 1
VLEAINAGIPDVCATIDCGLSKQVGKQLTQQAESFYFPIPIHDQATRHSGKHGDKQDGKGNGLGVGKPGDPAPTLTKGDKHAVLYENPPHDSRVTGPHDVAPSCVSRYGTGGGNVPLVQEGMAFQQNTRDEVRYINGDGAIAGALAAETGAKQQNYIHIKQSNDAIAFEPGIATREGSESRFVKELSPTLRKEMGDNQVAVSDNRMAVRRLSPRECERLQGFNDDHTLIPWRNKPADQCPDGPRYKALGNSMAVPCMAWIGERIEWIENERQGAA